MIAKKWLLQHNTRKKMVLKHPLDVSANKEGKSKIMSRFNKNTTRFNSEQGKKKKIGEMTDSFPENAIHM